jgi:hypothetical protein
MGIFNGLLEKWLANESPAEEDLLGTRKICRRIAGLLERDETVALIGSFGSGKSTIVGWLRRELQQRPGPSEIWFCAQSCWGFEDSTTAIHDLLRNALNVVREHADCFSLRSLPESYRKTFSAAGDWFRSVTDLILGSADPLSQFNELSDLLNALNARLVFIIEDLDRTTSTRFDRQEILALLHRLRSFKRLSFVLCTGPRATEDIDFTKLCDRIELIPGFTPDDVRNIVRAVREHSLGLYPDIPVDELDDPWEPTPLLLPARFDIVPISVAAGTLLQTPRALKHALRRTFQAWTHLHGEVDFDHLLAVNMLRHGAPSVFDFLLRNRTQLVDDPRTWRSGREGFPDVQSRLHAEWDALGMPTNVGRASLELLVFLIPAVSEYFDVRERVSSRDCFQGIREDRYWLRIVNEHVDATDVRDQRVLRDIDQWKALPEGSAALVEGLCSDADYASVWQKFAARVGGEECLLCLASHVLRELRQRFGMRATDGPNHMETRRGFIALWIEVKKVRRFENTAQDWLLEQLRLAAPVSLKLVNDLYHYWASSQHGIVRHEGRNKARGLILELLKKQLTTGESIISIAHPDLQYDLYQLIFPPGHDERPSEHVGIKEWAWLGPPLLAAFQRQPAMFAPKIACLILPVRPTTPGAPRGVRAARNASRRGISGQVAR